MSSGQNFPYLTASTPRSADVVLYLDLDGVVHHEKVLWHPRKGIYMSPYEAAGHSLFEWVPILESVPEPHPTVALVLSSTWCIRPGYSATLKRLPASLRARFIGGTYHRRVHGVDPWNQSMFRATPRGVRIQEDAQRRKPRQWVALVWCLKSNHQIMVLAARATDAKMVSALLCHTNGLGSSL